ncbi:transcriptional regulatory protein [Neofusicoccum parvum]|nr:transcriptional regulatory protein [Neofusicoccum parvum]
MAEVWAWFGIGVTVIFVRFGVRIRMVGFRGFEGDDYVTIMTLAMYTMDAALVDICYRDGTNVDVPPSSINGLTDSEIDRLRYGSKMQLAAWYSYTALIWCMKATMLFFYKRLTFGLWQHKALRYLAWFTALSYMAVVLTISLGCHPYDHNWQVRPLPQKECTLKKQNFLVTAVLNVLTDAAILCIPLPMLKQLKVPLFKKILIALLLSSGLFVITAAIIRAAVTLGSAPSSITINRWGVRETIIGILAINAPILRPILTRNFWTGSTSVQEVSRPSDSPAHTPTKRRGGKRVFGSKSTGSKSDNSCGTKKGSRSDSAAYGVDTNVTGFSIADNNSQENIMPRDEEQGIELAPLSERHSEENPGEAPVQVYVQRSYAAAGRADQCRFPPPGTSAIHRQSKRRRQTSDFSQQAVHENGSPARDQQRSYSNDGSHAVRALFPQGLDTALADVDGFQLMTDEIKNSYLRCSYKWCFHHTPTFLARVNDKTLDPWVVWAILALAVRFSRHAPGPYATPTEASNAFAGHARQILQVELETPSLSRIQALLMLTGHDWGAGNGRRAWFYLGMAIRMVQILNLCEETPIAPNGMPGAQDFIAAEERRRTAWTCFLMDSLLSGGKGRKRSLIWTLEAHNALEQGQGFIYMHCIHFMSLMFLHRAYLPVLGSGLDPQNNSVDSRAMESPDWVEWRKSSRRELFEVATAVCDMVDKIQSFGFYFVRGLVPWIGFTIYTAVGVIVYRNSFHFDEVDGIMPMAKSKEQVVRGCTFLKDMKEQWPMAQQWFETIKRMQACYRRVRIEGGSSIPDAEQRTIRSALIDYGALQPSPVQADEEGSTQTVPSSNPPDASIPARADQSGAVTSMDQIMTDDAFLTGDWANLDINISDADLDSMFMNATQDFWGSFPGEVGYF